MSDYNTDLREQLIINIICGDYRKELTELLLTNGLGEETARDEINRLARNPGISAARRLIKRAEKIEALLDIQHELFRKSGFISEFGTRQRLSGEEFYTKYFLPQIPPDIEIVPVSRTIGQGRLVDEIVIRFTHTISMDWMLHGLAPTGKRVEVAFVVVVQFDGDKMVHEHLYWDQASVLVQLGLLERGGLPVVGAEGARSLLDRSIRLNALIDRANRC